MRRGFKSQAEKLSLNLRDDIGLSARDRIDPNKFLESLGIVVWGPADVPGIDPDHVAQLTVRDPDSWSGMTVREGGTIAIIVNPTHPSTRQANTLMHEWAHIKLRHKPNRVDRSEHGLLLLSDYPAEIEEEADWLAGAILLPRDGLVYHRARGLSAEAVASHYGVSKPLANWRLRMTGVEKQMRNRF
jgi:hypothetical protein